MTPLDFFFYPFLFILGITLGSFYNVVAICVPRKESIIKPPSHCPKCQRKLNSIDLIPVFGYLIRTGKCVTCGAAISPLYLVGELLTGLLFVLAYIVYNDQPLELLLSLLLISLCMIVSISDLLYTMIPNKILLFFLPLFLMLRLVNNPESWTSYLVGGLLGFIVLLVPAIIKPGSMGMGDVKLMGLFGLIIGWQGVIITLFISSLLGLLVGLTMIATKAVQWKQGIPFGPYLCIGAIMASFWGQEILQWYIAFL